MYQPAHFDVLVHCPSVLSSRTIEPRAPFNSTDNHALVPAGSNTTRDIAK